MRVVDVLADTGPWRRAAPRLRERMRAGAAWWVEGARATCTPSWLGWLAGERLPMLLVRAVGTRVDADWIGTPPPGTGEGRVADVAAWLAEARAPRRAYVLALGLDASLFVRRDLRLPAEALPSLPAALAQDLALRTPFSGDEVWHGADVADTGGRTRAATHWIVRRDFAEQAALAAGLPIAGFDALAVVADGEVLHSLPLRPLPRAPVRQAPATLARLGMAAALVTVLALIGADTIESVRAGRAATELSDARRRFDASTTPDVRSLLALAAEPDVGQVWAELARLLPDDTFLTDLRVADGSVTLAGRAADPARLLRLIDGSPLFTGAALSGSIEPDSATGKNRFALSADLRGRPKRRGGARPAEDLP